MEVGDLIVVDLFLDGERTIREKPFGAIVKMLFDECGLLVHAIDSGLDVACGRDEVLRPMTKEEADAQRAEIRRLSAIYRAQAEAETPEEQEDLMEHEGEARATAANPGLHVQTAMNEIKLELARHGGITKDRNAPVGGGYAFRGIDDIYNVLCALTAQHRMNMYPRVVGTPTVEYQSYEKNGRGGEKIMSLQTHVHLMLDVKFVSAVDGSSEVVTTAGEAIDQGDKATNKAMSAAMKYACIMAFQIPVHGENVDIEAHDVSVAPAAARQVQAPAPFPQANEPLPPAAPAPRKRRSRDEVMAALPVAGEVVPPPAKPVTIPKGDLLVPAKETGAVATAITESPPPSSGESVNPDAFAQFDTSDGALDWQILAAKNADAAESFSALFAIAKDADPRDEPARGVVFDHVCKRLVTLIQDCPTQAALGEAKGLIKALGSLQPLLNAYNAKYATFRQGATQ